MVTDGRNTIPTSTTLADIEQRARNAKIPIFVVGVGVERPQVRIDFADVRAPPPFRRKTPSACRWTPWARASAARTPWWSWR